jgi:aryl-alcohol dehydrogenase-like predicted oxidoreductase
MSDMMYRSLGDSGLVVSVVGIGCNAFGRRVDQDGVAALLRAAAWQPSPEDLAELDAV